MATLRTSKIDEILFPVRLVETTEAFGYATNSDYSHAVIGTIDGVDTILNVCSDRYKLLDNNSIFPVIENKLNEKGIPFTVQYSMTNNAVFSARYTIEDKNFQVGKGNDQIKPMFMVNHSYNGLAQYSITFGYFRLVCSNGLVIPLEGYEEKNYHIKGKHTQKIVESFDTLMEKLDLFFENSNKIVKKYEVLYDTKIENYADRVEAVMSATGLNPVKTYTSKKGVKTENRDALNDVLATIRTEMATLGETTANDWLVYNGINRFIFDDDKNVKSNIVRTELDRKVLAEIMNK